MFDNLSIESKTYLNGILFIAVTILILTAVCSLVIVANNLGVVMMQKAKITYTYFIMIMDRILLFSLILGILPLTVIQLISKNKTREDKTLSMLAAVLFVIAFATFANGQYYFYKTYKSGDLSTSGMFCEKLPEIELFNKIIIRSGNHPPQMCLPPEIQK